MSSTTRPHEEREIQLLAGGEVLDGVLAVPPGAIGLVLFAHGSGSSRFSPRNRFVADALRREGLATLLFDLLTSEEETEDTFTARLRFDIPLLARRLVAATEWAAHFPETEALPIGYFGSSTGAAAAIVAAGERPDLVQAVVSRGGRPDLAAEALERLRAPCLLIVGGDDAEVLELNEEALERLHATKDLAIVPGATHLFEEPGALERVAALAARWFVRHLARFPVEAHP